MSSERRLHPLTILFEIGESLRQFAIPIILLLFAGSRRSGGADVGPALAVALFGAFAAIGRYLAFRYRYDPSELVVRSGIFVKEAPAIARRTSSV